MSVSLDIRREIVRAYLADIDANSAVLLEAQDALSYLRWNLQQLTDAALRAQDTERKIVRVHKDRRTIEEGGTLIHLESPMVDIVLGRMGKVIESGKSFDQWFHRALLAPVLAEEIRLLTAAGIARVDTLGMRTYCDRVAERVRFKVWEDIVLPGVDLATIPPRFEPSPDELHEPTIRLE